MNEIQSAGLSEKKLNASSIGMLLFITVEVMFFMGLISAYFIAKKSTSVWPPLGQPRLPIASTALNTFILLSSGFFLFLSQKALHETCAFIGKSKRLFIYSLILGACFVIFQGVEWFRLISFGLTVKSSTFGSFFYIIIGAHAFHAIAAIGLILSVFLQKEFSKTRYSAASLFWYFVVLMWPVIYISVYIL